MKRLSQSVAWERIIPLATLLLISLIAAGPLWGPGLLNTRAGGDSPFLLLRTHQLAVNLRAGALPARWMPDAAHGFGYPFFNYYAALPYYVAASFTVVGLNILTAVKLTQTLFFAAAAVGMYHWAKRALHSQAGGWLAAVTYTLAPYHLVNVYVRGDSLSEFAAFAFYPLILFGLDRLSEKPSIRQTLLTALAYAGLITTHNISALIFSPFVLLCVAFHVFDFRHQHSSRTFKSSLSRCSRLLLPLLLGVLLSAWFWLPAMAETGHVQLDAQTTGFFFYGNHFRGTDLVQWRFPFDYSFGGRASPFATGLVPGILALIGLSVVVITWMRSRSMRDIWPESVQGSRRNSSSSGVVLVRLGFGLVGLLASTWLVTPLSRPLWDHLPLLPMVQFPWRFLSVQAVFAALLTGALVLPVTRRWGAPTTRVATVAMAILLATTLLGLRPEYLPVTADEVTAERLQLYELFTGNIGSTIRHEYLPQWVKPRPYIGLEQFSPNESPKAIALSGELLRAERLERGPVRRVWDVAADSGGADVAFPLYYWPGWRAAVDGVRVETVPVPDSGYLSLRVPTGSHSVEIWLGHTPLRRGAEIASLTAAITIVALWVRERRRAEKPRDKDHGTTKDKATHLIWGTVDVASLIAYAPAMGLLALLIAFHPRVSAVGPRDLTMDFEEMPYLHHNPHGVRVGDRRLTGYGYTEETVAPGQTLTVTLDWERGEDDPAEKVGQEPTKLQLISPGAVRDDSIPPLAEVIIEPRGEQETVGSEGSTTLDLSVPRDVPPGLLFVQVLTEPPITLRPIRVTSEQKAAGKPTLTLFSDDTIRLHACEVTQPNPDRLGVEFQWSATGPIAANYALSVSLTDPDGNEWLHQGSHPRYNTQPGQGFLPTSLWPMDRLINDRHYPSLRLGAPPGDSYTLTVRLYRASTWDSIGEYKKVVSLTEVFQLPDAPVIARFGDEIALSRLALPERVRQGDTLAMTAYWLALKKPLRDYTAEWRLQTPEQSISGTRPLAPGSPPTTWSADAWVAGRAKLPVPSTASAGEYTLSVTLQDPASKTVVGQYVHGDPVAIEERKRIWKLPPMDEQVGVDFGGVIELAGYNIALERERLRLTLHWQALATPDEHYMFFVHLADPETGQPVEQVDTMPRGFAYPTGMWAPGEIVSDDVELSLNGVPAGTYDLAVGWFDPVTGERLPAVDKHGKPLADDRLVLPDGLTLP